MMQHFPVFKKMSENFHPSVFANVQNKYNQIFSSSKSAGIDLKNGWGRGI